MQMQFYLHQCPSRHPRAFLNAHQVCPHGALYISRYGRRSAQLRSASASEAPTSISNNLLADLPGIVRIPHEALKQGGLPLGPAMTSEQRAAYAATLKSGFLPVNLNYPGLRCLNIDPPVFTVENFAPPEVVDALREQAAGSGLMAQSKIGGLGQLTDTIRTSTTLALTADALIQAPGLGPPLDALLERAAALVDLQALGQQAGSLRRGLFTKPDPGSGHVVPELPQVARYTPGQHFLAHEDAFPPPVALNKGYQRRATLLVYLNDVPQGGATRFEHLGPLDVQPAAGSALLFFPSFSGGRPDARTLHTAVDAVDEKWVFQLWLTSGIRTSQPRSNASQAAGQTGQTGSKPHADKVKAAAVAAAGVARTGTARKSSRGKKK